MSDTEREIAELKLRIGKIESQMSSLLRRLNIGAEGVPARDASAKVIELVRKGDKKGAIRAFMDETSCSLNDARRYVESLKV
jgi:hypothetical protein